MEASATGPLDHVAAECDVLAHRPLVFLSYAHEDKELCRRLSVMLGIVLNARGYELWWDKALTVGEWNPQVDQALERAVAGLLLVSVDALNSEFIMKRELPHLLERGPVAPIYARPCPFPAVPAIAALQFLGSTERSLAEMDDRAGELEAALNDIASQAPEFLGLTGTTNAAPSRPLPNRPGPARPSGALGQLHGVPELPASYCERAAELDRLRSLLLAAGSGAIGLAGSGPLGLHGIGGIGKTVLAVAAARDEAVRAAFPDGVFWVVLGERPDPVSAQAALARLLGLEITFRDPEEGRAVLTEAFAAKSALVVIDDAWSAADAETLAVTGPQGRLLVTSRHTLVLERLRAHGVEVGRLSPDDARRFLAHVTGRPDPLPPEGDELLEPLGGVVLALALVGATIRHGTSWAEAVEGVRQAAALYSDESFANQFKAMHLALGALDDADRRRYGELVVFSEDVTVPLLTIERLWRHSGCLDRIETTALVARLGARNLASVDGGVRFHDLQRAYLQLQTADSAVAHGRLLAAHREALADPERWSTLADDEPYLWDHLVEHLVAAGDVAGLRSLVSDPAWLLRRYDRGGPHSPESDLRLVVQALPADPLAPRLQRRLRQISHLLAAVKCLGDRALTLAMHLRDLVSTDMLCALYPPVRLLPEWALGEAPEPLERVLAEQEGEVTSVAWSPDGRWVASGGDDGQLRLWDPDTAGQPPLVLFGHEGGVRSVAWDPLGRRMASGGVDGAVRIWQPDPGTQRPAVLTGHRGEVWCVAWSHEGRLASGGLDGTVRVWLPASADRRPVILYGHGGEVRAVTWSPDGRRLASASSDLTLRVWNLPAAGQPATRFHGHRGGLWSVAWSPDGRRLASAGFDGTVRIWDADAPWDAPIVLSGHGARVASLAWSPDGRQLASGGGDGKVRVWEPHSPEPASAVLGGHGGWVTSVSWSPDGRRLASGCADGRVRIWDPASASQATAVLAAYEGGVRSLTWSPDGHHLATGRDDGTVRLWQPDSPDRRPTVLLGSGSEVTSVAWSPDGRWLAAGDRDGTVRTWDVKAPLSKRPNVFADHGGGVTSVAWSPGGRQLASGCSDGRVRIWEATSAKQTPAALAGRDASVATVAWSPDGQRLASGHLDGRVHIWNPQASGQRPQLLEGHDGPVRAVSWSPDGHSLASGGTDGAVRIWDPRTGEQALVLLAGYPMKLTALSWSPDGRRLVCGGHDGTVRAWDLQSRTELCAIALGLSVSATAWHADRVAIGTGLGWTILRVEEASG